MSRDAVCARRVAVVVGPATVAVGVARNAAEAGIENVVVIVEGETRATVDRTERPLRSGRTQHPETVERTADLLAESVDVDALLHLS